MTREEWLRHAVEELDVQLFEGALNLLEHNYQISLGKCGGKRLTECFQPYEGEDVTMDDFFPTTIIVSHSIADPIEMIGALGLECIHAFFNIKGTPKAFKMLAEKYYYEAPFKYYNPSEFLKDILNVVYKNLVSKYGEFPGKPVVVRPKEKKEKNKNSYTLFCPECGFELKASKKMLKKHNGGMPTCPCGTKMGCDYGEETEETEI